MRVFSRDTRQRGSRANLQSRDSGRFCSVRGSGDERSNPGRPHGGGRAGGRQIRTGCSKQSSYARSQRQTRRRKPFEPKGTSLSETMPRNRRSQELSLARRHNGKLRYKPRSAASLLFDHAADLQDAALDWPILASTIASAAATACARVMLVESRRTASAAGLRGESARLRSRSSRAWSSRRTSSG